jgi:hypothetical protein
MNHYKAFPYKLTLSAAAAAAVSMAFSGNAAASNGSPGAPASIGAGASAVKNSILRGIIGVNGATAALCGANAATLYDNATADVTVGTAIPGGSIFRVVCGANDVSYDTNGGSWKGLNAADPAGNPLMTIAQGTNNANPVKWVATAGTASAFQITSFTVQGNTFTFNAPVNYVWGAATANAVAGTDFVDFGMTDVEPALFNDSINQPFIDTGTCASPALSCGNLISNANVAQVTGIGKELAGYPQAAFGVVFGVGVSPALLAQLQTAQALPASCVGVSGFTTQACAPNVSIADYRSIMSGNGSASLIAAYGPAPIFWARRDQGSGTKASENAFFLNHGCSTASASTEGATLSPFLPGNSNANYTVQYNYSTGAVLTSLKVAGNHTIGVISAENDSAGKLGTASMTFLDGQYPTSANAAAGLYPYVSTEVFHCSKNSAAGVCAAIASDFTTLPTAGGLVNLSTTNFANNNGAVALGNICNGQVRVR